LEERSRQSVRRILSLLRQRAARLDLMGADRDVVEAVGRVLGRRLLAKEREFYRFHLLHGGPQDSTSGRQRQLAELLESTLGRIDFEWSPLMVNNLAKDARGNNWDALAHRLGRIRTSETVLAPVSALFTHMLGLDKKGADVLTKRLRDEWGRGLRTVSPEAFAELRAEIAGGDAAAGERWVGIADALAAGDYGKLLELLVEQNKAVMAARGGAPWVEKRGGKLHVRFHDEHGSLPGREELPALWRFPYFLDSLRSVAAALKENRGG
jgi:hypothetical protein